MTVAPDESHRPRAPDANAKGGGSCARKRSHPKARLSCVQISGTRVPASPIFRRARRGRRDTWSGKCVHISPPATLFLFDKTAVPVRARRTRTPTVVTAAGSASIAAAAGAAAYRLVTSGALTLDLGVGRRLQPLGPLLRAIAAPREVVFDVIAAPYLERTPQALEEKLQVWERGSDMVLAAHHTRVKCGVTTTLETVRFERPDRVDFRLVRGPVPHVVESFLLTPSEERAPCFAGKASSEPTSGRSASGGATGSHSPGNTPSTRVSQGSPTRPNAAQETSARLRLTTVRKQLRQSCRPSWMLHPVVHERRVPRLPHAEVLEVRRAREPIEQALPAAQDHRRDDDRQLLD
jgi:hypothetical protein